MDLFHLIKREVGESPTLSRNCIQEFDNNATVLFVKMGRCYCNVDHKSGDLPLMEASIDLRGQGGVSYCMIFVNSSKFTVYLFCHAFVDKDYPDIEMAMNVPPDL